MQDSLSPVALSRLTWTFEDRRAWEDTYRACLLVAVMRDERTREEAVPLAVKRTVRRFDVCQDPSCESYGADLDAGLCPSARYSVHADNYGRKS